MALTEKEIAALKERLLEMKAKMSQILEGTNEEAKGLDDDGAYSQHQADQGTDDFNRTVSLELSSQEYKLLKQIDRALEKMEEGTYGTCDISGDAIPKKRLEVMPYATMTVVAQEKMEKGLM